MSDLSSDRRITIALNHYANRKSALFAEALKHRIVEVPEWAWPDVEFSISTTTGRIFFGPLGPTRD